MCARALEQPFLSSIFLSCLTASSTTRLNNVDPDGMLATRKLPRHKDGSDTAAPHLVSEHAEAASLIRSMYGFDAPDNASPNENRSALVYPAIESTGPGAHSEAVTAAAAAAAAAMAAADAAAAEAEAAAAAAKAKAAAAKKARAVAVAERERYERRQSLIAQGAREDQLKDEVGCQRCSLAAVFASASPLPPRINPLTPPTTTICSGKQQRLLLTAPPGRGAEGQGPPRLG